MLASLVFQLNPSREATLPKTNGHKVHGAFLDLMGQLDRDLADRLHADEPAKPFTVSALRGGTQQGKEVAVAPRDSCSVRVTSLDARLSAELLGGDLPGRTLRIGAATFTISAVCSTAGKHEWARRDSFETLARRFANSESDSSSALNVAFESPTTFKRGNRSLPLPVPALVFGGVVQKWRRHAPPSLRDVFDGWTLDGGTAPVLLKRHTLRTHMLLFGENRQQTGFSGETTFQLPRSADDRFRGLLQLLGAFAFYAGVGYRTPWGMGQVRVASHQ
jgi:CRISPR-associated endoribonuclease Cas6